MDELGVSQGRHLDEAVSEGHAAPNVFPGKRLCVFDMSGSGLNGRQVGQMRSVHSAAWWRLGQPSRWFQA